MLDMWDHVQDSPDSTHGLQSLQPLPPPALEEAEDWQWLPEEANAENAPGDDS